VLARQFLLERVDLPLDRVLERMGFLQAQYAPSMYIGLWARIEGFGRHDLTRALEDRRVVQGTLLRATIHLVSAEDWWRAALAVREHRRRWWIGAHKGSSSALAEVEAAAARVRDLLATGPRRRAAILAEVGIDSTIWNGVGLWLDLVRVPPSGTWEHRRADLYALAEDWIGPPASGVNEASGMELLLARYLAAFGPASLSDAANWAGVPSGSLEPVVERLDLRRFRSEDGTLLLDVAGGGPAGIGHRRARPFPSDVGRGAPRTRPPHPGPEGGAPAPALLDQEPAVDAELPRRRPGRRDVAV
jgi:hypothetical protein